MLPNQKCYKLFSLLYMKDFKTILVTQLDIQQKHFGKYKSLVQHLQNNGSKTLLRMLQSQALHFLKLRKKRHLEMVLESQTIRPQYHNVQLDLLQFHLTTVLTKTVAAFKSVINYSEISTKEEVLQHPDEITYWQSFLTVLKSFFCFV